MGNDDAKRLILARRAKFVAAALAGVAGMANACGGSTEETGPANPQPCLDVECCPDADPEPCLGALPPDAGGPRDGGDAASDATSTKDAEPQPCLSPPIGDE